MESTYHLTRALSHVTEVAREGMAALREKGLM